MIPVQSNQELKSKFFQILDKALYTKNPEFYLGNLYRIRDFVTDSLAIKYTDDIETIEYVVRTLIYLDMEFKVLGNTLEIINCPEEEKDFTAWFVKFFAYLESADKFYYNGNYDMFPPNENHISVLKDPHAPTEIDVTKLLFGYPEIKVEFLSQENSEENS